MTEELRIAGALLTPALGAIGVGLTQVLPFDALIAAEGAKLSVRFIRMGLVPELASSQFLLQRVGFGAASDLMLTGRTVLAEEAQALGLVDRVVARPTPSAPPSTEAPLITPTSVIRMAKRKLFESPCRMSSARMMSKSCAK